MHITISGSLVLSSASGSGDLAILRQTRANSKGAFFYVNKGELKLFDLLLENGKTTNPGGALYIQGDVSSTAKVTMLRSTIRGCEASKNGGAIYMTGGGVSGKAVLVLISSSLELNKGGGDGGGAGGGAGA